MSRRFLLSTLFLAFVPAMVFGLAMEQFGNKPIQGGLGESPNLLKAVNVEARVYWFEVNGNPWYFFKGGPKELNQAIRDFLALPDEKKEILLLHGPGVRSSLTREKKVEYDWSIHVPMGLRHPATDDRAILTIHINDLSPPPIKDVTAIKKHIASLSSDNFRTREAATAAIAAEGPSAAATLREALRAPESGEARDRLERLLEKVTRTIRVDTLEIPSGAVVIGRDQLVDRHRAELKDKNATTRGLAISSMVHYGADDVLADLSKVLQEETHEYAQRCAIGSAGNLGRHAVSLLPRLRELAKSKDENVSRAAESAIKAIESAPAGKEDVAYTDRQRKLNQEIRSFVSARGTKQR